VRASFWDQAADALAEVELGNRTPAVVLGLALGSGGPRRTVVALKPAQGRNRVRLPFGRWSDDYRLAGRAWGPLRTIPAHQFYAAGGVHRFLGLGDWATAAGPEILVPPLGPGSLIDFRRGGEMVLPKGKPRGEVPPRFMAGAVHEPAVVVGGQGVKTGGLPAV